MAKKPLTWLEQFRLAKRGGPATKANLQHISSKKKPGAAELLAIEKKRQKANKQRKKQKLADEQRAKSFTSYHEYIGSKEWAKKRKKAFRKHGRKCSICSSTRALQVHHKHYKTLYREGMDDLQILCADCHANHHEGKRGVVMDPMTAEFLSLKL